jgi:thioredoxin 1
MNSFRQLDVWGTADKPGTPASVVTTVTENSFDDAVVDAQQPVLVDFYSDNSEDSKAMVPVVADLSNHLKESIKVVRMDADESPEMTKRYEVTTLPDFFFFKNGAKVGHITGKMSEDELFAFVKRCNGNGETAVESSNKAQ